jgi:xylan 1,4-beta-xylosidase
MIFDGTRRQTIRAALGLAAAGAIPPASRAAAPPKIIVPVCIEDNKNRLWARGLEGQRRADLGNGTYLNPVLAGDHPDPSILKDDAAYYKVSSSFDYYPGLVIWHSPDLVNWVPVGPTLHTPIGSVLAPDLVKHNGTYFIYIAVLNANLQDMSAPRPYGDHLPLLTNYVLHAPAIEGPWSDPIDLNLQHIDPGHAVGDDGKRYLFLAGGMRVRLTDDGLKTAGPIEKVYDGWPIPTDWVIEGFALEGPKIVRRGDWFYAFWAEGGTAGPPTSHMVVVARARSIDGPWENSPHNPLVHTTSPDEPFLSRGHGTPVEGPNGDWWIVYHGYENGFRTLGRQFLLEPLDWPDNAWPRATGGALSRPLRKPLPASNAPHGTPFSGDFTTNAFGPRWTFFMPTPDYRDKARLAAGALRLTASGTGPHESTLLVINPGDHRYSVTMALELSANATGGLLLLYNRRVFCGVASSATALHLYKLGAPELFVEPGPAAGPSPHMRLVAIDNVASFHISDSGATWRMVASFEVAGYNHNVFDGFLSLRPALFAAGTGEVTVRNVVYESR